MADRNLSMGSVQGPPKGKRGRDHGSLAVEESLEEGYRDDTEASP